MRTFICTITFSLAIVLSLSAQQLPNSGFESWSHMTFTEPDTFLSSNMFGSGGIGNVTRSTDAYHGTYALQMETVVSGSDTVQGMVIIGTPGNQTINGGLPFTSTPDSVSGYVKYDIQPLDTAYFIVGFKQGGTFFAQAATVFYGSQPTYTRFCIPTNLSSLNPPDSIAVIITSSTLDYGKVPGSTVTIDSISFLHSAQEFPNGDFENWNDINTNEDPDGWGSYAGQFPFYNLPLQVTKTNDVNSGSFAVRLTSDTATVQPPFGTGLPGDTVLGILHLNMLNGFASTPFPFTYRPDSLVGYVKGVVTAATDNFNTIWVQLTNNSNTVGQVMYAMTSSLNDYTRFATAVTYFASDVPDSMTFYIFAGNPGNPVPGNVFYVDDLSFVYNPVSAETQFADKIFAYPNPAKNLFSIYSSGSLMQSVVIYNSSGVAVLELMPNSEKTDIDISGLHSGLYFYKVNGSSCGRFVKE